MPLAIAFATSSKLSPKVVPLSSGGSARFRCRIKLGVEFDEWRIAGSMITVVTVRAKSTNALQRFQEGHLTPSGRTEFSLAHLRLHLELRIRLKGEIQPSRHATTWSIPSRIAHDRRFPDGERAGEGSCCSSGRVRPFQRKTEVGRMEVTSVSGLPSRDQYFQVLRCPSTRLKSSRGS